MSARLLTSAKAQMAAGEYYEAHQRLRTLANRYMKAVGQEESTQADPPVKVSQTIDLLVEGARTFLEHNQTSSAADLIAYVLDIYGRFALPPAPEASSASTLASETNANTSSAWWTRYAADKQRLTVLLMQMPASEPQRPRLLKGLLNWSTKVTQRLWILEHGAEATAQTGEGSTWKLPAYLSAGDPDLHHLLGTRLAQDRLFEAAEAHLLLGIHDSAPRLAQLMHTWAAQSTTAMPDEPMADSGLFAARAVLPYLALHKPNSASYFMETYLAENPPHDASASNGGGPGGALANDPLAQYQTLASSPMAHFCQLLLLAVERQAKEVFLKLRREYPVQWGASSEAANQLLDIIGETYFNISIPKQSNPFQDIMQALFAPGGSNKPSLLPSGGPGLD
ncbi:hypothetical protein H4R33_000468 [Dimargaris cristalligena]|nr:hypothetical protein H4R33_000468 [Dimargaris cristalligena]